MVCVTFAADRVSEAQQESYSDEESKACSGQNSYSYEIGGKRYSVPYEMIGDQVVLEGDIVVGQTADILKGGANYIAPVVPDYVRGQLTRWGNRVPLYVVPFVIDSSAKPYEALIRTAMSEWASKTSIRFRELSGPRDWKHENYVKFISGELCGSNSLGIKEKFTTAAVSEKDNINEVQVAGYGNSWGSIAHEIGHVLGLGYEQSRRDRDNYIAILWGNIKKEKGVQYCRVIWDQRQW
jgi:hypothetical protein